MLEVFDRLTRQRVAICENAFGIEEDRQLNALWMLRFSIPADDPKAAYLKPYTFVRYDGGEMYRILPKTQARDEADILTVDCEHVLATLMDTTMVGWHQIGNTGTYTDEVLEYLLAQQRVKHWKMGVCDFRRQFEYGWEQESILSAMFSVPKPFDAEYRWEFDTKSYPWTISLRRLDETRLPSLYVRDGHNLRRLQHLSDPTNLCTRLYAYGVGEGINQLGIASVNGGLPYIEDAEAIAEYGLIERVWVDRRYTSAGTLLGAARRMLDGLKKPAESYEVDVANIDGPRDGVVPGERVHLVTEQHTDIIVGVRYTYGEYTDMQITLANTAEDIAETVAKLADRARVEATYSQGATQIYEHTIQDNADSTNGGGLIVDFFIPSEMIYINKLAAKIRMRGFRAYSKATDVKGSKQTTSTETATTISGGSTNTSTGGGGSTTVSGGSAYTGSGGGGQVGLSGGGIQISSATVLPSSNIIADDRGGENARNHNHGIDTQGFRLALTDWDATQILGSTGFVPSGAHIHGEHTHSVNTSFYLEIPSHTHNVNTSHSHSIPSHTHNVNTSHSHKIPAHSHTLDFTHSHEVTPGIFRFGSPKSFSLYVGDRKIATYTDVNDTEIDLLAILTADGGTVGRGTWQSIEIRPNTLAHISCTMYTQGFIQSRGTVAV